MILKPYFRKHFFLILAVFIAIIGLCALGTHYLMKFQMDRIFKDQAENLIRQIEGHAGNQTEYVGELNEMNRKVHSPVQIELKNEGEEIGPSFGPKVVEPITIDNKKMIFVLTMAHPRGPLAPSQIGAGTGPMSPPPPGRFGPPGPARFPGFIGPVLPFLSLIFSVILASAVSVVLIYRSFRDKAALAKDVLSKMQHGDLKARFPISRWDEASQIFILYNQMADEIERLVERLRQDEAKRVGLLQELAHDLRTPVASLKSSLETIHFDEKSLDEAAKQTLTGVALHEVEYINRLVEDLLFLALVLEPKYKNASEEILVRDLLSDQMNVVSATYPKVRCRLIDDDCGKFSVVLGSRQLLRRLFRNALENACSFAKSEVTVVISQLAGKLKIAIQDNGPGISRAALESFGKKKASRYQEPNGDGRISVGLGSVIIQAIVSAHAGRATIQNSTDADGKIMGAELSITLDLSPKVPAA